MMGLRIGLGLGARNGGGAAAPTGGTSATRYSFAATRFRIPTNTRQISGANNYLIQQFAFASPGYDVTNPRFYLPSFWQGANGGSSPETANANNIVIEGLSIKVGATWYSVPATNLPLTIDPTTMPGALLDAIPVTIPANTTLIGRVAYNVPASGFLPTTTRATVFGGSGLVEGSEGNTTTRFAKLTNDAALTNTLSHSDSYQPLYMVAQGGDGRPAIAIFGDSIGYGANEASGISALWSNRGAYGYVARGLDDATATKRIACANFCIPGSRPLDIATRNSTFSAKKLDAIKAVYNATGEWPFDEVISQHGTNSIAGATNYATLLAGMQTYLAILKTENSKPITQIELLPKATTTDGYATLGNMACGAHDAYPSGQRWLLNTAIGGANGLGDPAATLRASGHIDGSFAPWLNGSYDLTTNRDKQKLRAFNTTLAASAAQNATSFSMVASPALGEYLNIAYTGGYADGHVTAITGSGPYTVTMAMTSNIGASGAPSAAVVRAQEHALDGTHPGSLAHKDDYAQAVTGWKTARGWV